MRNAPKIKLPSGGTEDELTVGICMVFTYGIIMSLPVL